MVVRPTVLKSHEKETRSKSARLVEVGKGKSPILLQLTNFSDVR